MIGTLLAAFALFPVFLATLFFYLLVFVLGHNTFKRRFININPISSPGL